MPAKRSAAPSPRRRKKASSRKRDHTIEQGLQDLLKSPQQSLREAVEKSADFLRKAARDAKKAIDMQAKRAARNRSKLKRTAAKDPIAASALLLRQATEYLNDAMESVSKEINSRLGGKSSKKRPKRAPARKK